MFCRKCGKEIPDDSEFCYKCGSPITRVSDDNTKTLRNEPINLEKEELKPPVEKSDKRMCSNCGQEILVPTVRICPYCGEMQSQTDKPPETDTGLHNRYKKASTALDCSNDIDTLQNARDTFLSLGAYIDSHQKAQECMDKIQKILNNNETAASGNAGQTPVKSRTNETFPEEDYAQFKSGLNIAVIIIIIIFFGIMLLSGNASCTGFGEIGMTRGNWLIYLFVGIGLVVLRGIILLIYKNK